MINDTNNNPPVIINVLLRPKIDSIYPPTVGPINEPVVDAEARVPSPSWMILSVCVAIRVVHAVA